MPRISIGLPVYNGERFLRESLDSVLAQTYEDFELIISDNASTDSTEDICRTYAAEDKRIRYYRNEKNVGAADNYNNTFNMSSGEYFKWISHDDVCASTFLEKCIEILDREPSAVVCYPKTILMDANGRKISEFDDNLSLSYSLPNQRLGRFLTNYNLANAVFGLIRSAMLRKTRLIGKYYGGDYILLVELCLQGTFHEVPEYLFFRRDHDLNSRKLSKSDRAAWWGTSNHGIKNDEVKLFYEHYMSIRRSELGWYEKLLCYMQISKWVSRRLKMRGIRYKAILEKKFGPI